MATADRVIAKFGGQNALAALIGKRQSTVQYWSKTGIVPARWQPKLLRLAAERGIDLRPDEFVAIPLDDPEPKKDALVPVARWAGNLELGDFELPCYVLDDGRRLISRNAATGVLTEKGSGNLESYLKIAPLREYLPADELPGQMVEFIIPEITNKTARGITAETFLDICHAYVKARDANLLTTDRQLSIAVKATAILAASAKVGLIALIDEATGYQYERTQDALRVKLKIYLEDEMRKWEKTFPDELWKEFARLTRWKGSVLQRPKYWGKLVMELVYGYLDRDVAEWLRTNAPKPRHGQNYHQWLSGQYGLKRLVEHLWLLVGMASACHSMSELRDKMAEKFGRERVQLTLYLPPPAKV